MNKKLVALILLITLAIMSFVAYIEWEKLHPKPKDNMTARWYPQNNFTGITVEVWSGDLKRNISRVEAIYVPNETLGLIWIEQRIIEPHNYTHYWFDMNPELYPYREEFLNLLQKQPLLRIEVETTRAIYTFHPYGFGYAIEATTIERK